MPAPLPWNRTASAPSRCRTSPAAWAIPLAILLLALVVAGCLYAHFLTCHRALWDDPFHDRNAHYLYSLKLATAVREGQVFRLLSELNEGRIWPPLHGVLAAGVLLVGGLDYRLAVLPSLAGWILTVLFGFLTARRCLRRGGTLAGLIAVLFIAASPAHRAYATDIMLESLGAGLTLMALYAYLLTAQGRTDEPWKARFLALSLLALFLEKYNYWLLVVAALLATEGLTRARFYRAAIFRHFRALDWRAWRTAPLRSPLVGAASVVLLLSAWIAWRGDRPFSLFGRTISVYPPHNPLHIAYVLILLYLARWWRRGGRNLLRSWDDRLRQIALWHLMPLSVWFLLPKHPSYFLWYLSLGNRTPEQRMDVAAGVRDYSDWFVTDYNNGSLIGALLGVAACVLALLLWRRLRPSGRVVLVLAVLATLLTLIHPNHKGRMLHSWIASVWVSAGVGAAVLLRGRPRLRPWRGGAALAALAWAQYPALIAAGHALEGGPHPERPCFLEVADAYLGDLADARRAVVLTAAPLKPLAQWTFLERDGRLDRLEEHWYGFGPLGEANRRGFQQWLVQTDSEAIVFCEPLAPLDGSKLEAECHLHGELTDLLQTQNIFRVVKEEILPRTSCRVRIWRRAEERAAAPLAFRALHKRRCQRLSPSK